MVSSEPSIGGDHCGPFSRLPTILTHRINELAGGDLVVLESSCPVHWGQLLLQPNRCPVMLTQGCQTSFSKKSWKSRFLHEFS